MYGIVKGMAFILMIEFCATIKKHLKPLIIPKLTRNKIKYISASLSSLHKIPYILNAINRNHIVIIAPKIYPKSYYYCKGFYSTLIQGIVNANCNFWGYDCQWACNIHDWVFFFKRKFWKSCDEGQVLTLQVDGRCCLFNVTMVLFSFKGEIYGLPRYQTHWNFI